MKTKTILFNFLFIAIVYSSPVLALTNDEIRQAIVRDSVAQYLATGHPCACPYNLARNGSSCGARSAYSRPGGAEPLCYPSDINDNLVESWKRQHKE